jgi:hypothetical protein
MKRATIGVMLSIALILITTNSIWGSKDIPKTEKLFEGRILTIYLKGGVFGAGTILKEVTIEDVAGTKTLVGNTVGQDDDEDTIGLQMYIPWENVLNLYSLTPEQAETMKAKQ